MSAQARRGRRACPVCGEMFEPRKVHGAWTRACSDACGQAIPKPAPAPKPVMTDTGKTRHTCVVCGHVRFVPTQSRKPVSRTCSKRCARKLTKDTPVAAPVAKRDPYSARSRKDSERWGSARTSQCSSSRCERKGGQKIKALHHIVFRQHVENERGDEWDPRNAMTVCPACHAAHHARVRLLLAVDLPDSVFEFASELMGPGRAYNYLRRGYEGPDARLDRLLQDWQAGAVSSVKWDDEGGAG